MTATAGLTAVEAARRLAEGGPNEIARQQVTPRWRIALAQFSSPLVLILIGAAIVSAFVSAIEDAIAIVVIIGVNGVIGFVQETRAEAALMALRTMTAARATVVRDGTATLVPAIDIVVGDVLVLAPGDVVAADATLLEVASLNVVESVLTGESMPVEKVAASKEHAADERPLAERTDVVFMGTTAATGTGRAVVTATAMATELGKIAHLLAQAEPSGTPLQKRLDALGRILLYVTVGLVGVVALLGWLRGTPWFEVLLTTVSLAVSAVPEGLPAVVTVAMAVGVRRLSGKGVLVRRLSAVETLGCASVICTDKTGTLTTGVMTLRDVWTTDREALLRAAAACCDADLADGQGVGDPTEVAILVGAKELGITREAIEREQPRRRTLPFDTDRRRMSVWREGGEVFVKGAAESVLPLTVGADADAVMAAVAEMAGRGLRVLAVAVGRGEDESGLELRGLVGLADAPRAEARAAIAAARDAGVRVVMITGDHPLTAVAIGRELGLVDEGSDPSLTVHARKTASDKTAIVRELRQQGQVVAMTGDGVNDAPSIREADIGIAMGKSATEVTREAADMVLTADDLGGVVTAIREGRIVYDNIRKTVIYLLSGNAAGLLMMLAASIAGWPLPLLPLHLLWLNIMCEPLPGVALALDAPDDDAMRRPPRPSDEPLLDRAAWIHIGWVASLHAVVAMGAFAWGLQRGSLPLAQTLAFSSLVVGVLLRAFSSRNPDKLLWEVGWAKNALLVGVVAFSLLLQLALVSFDLTRQWFSLAPLRFVDLLLLVGLGFVPVTVVEIGKLVHRRRNRPVA